MIREQRLKAKPVLEDGFRLRGTSVSRLEAFSDGVFAVAIALVIVSDSGDGSTFPDLLRRMQNVPATAACFAILYMIWSRHYLYFRRFGLENVTVRVITGVLLFCVALYAFPLKFVFETCVRAFFNIGGTGQDPHMTYAQVPLLMLMYGAGLGLVHACFAAFYWHAWNRRSELGLSPLEAALTKLETWQSLGYTGLAAGCVVLAYTLPLKYSGFSGFGYCLAAIVGTIHGHHVGEARKKLGPLEKLQPVAEGVPALEPVDARNSD